MANSWLRLWHELPNDPKWRTISRLSKQPIPSIIAVYVHMLVCASNASERGRTQNWSDEDCAASLDLEPEQVESIRVAMQGRVLSGDRLTGWEKRQPKREDDAAERARAWRERNRTQPNAVQRNPNAPDKDTDADKEKRRERVSNPSDSKRKTASRLALAAPTPDFLEYAKEKHGWDIQRSESVFEKFADHHKAHGSLMLDWLAAWRTWCRNEQKYEKVAVARNGRRQLSMAEIMGDPDYNAD